MTTPTGSNLLRVSSLTITTSGREPTTLVEGAHLHIDRGEIVGIVGESGSGKTLTSSRSRGFCREACR